MMNRIAYIMRASGVRMLQKNIQFNKIKYVMEQFKHKESNPKLYHTLFKDERIFNEKSLLNECFTF